MCVVDVVGMERVWDGVCSIGFNLYFSQHQEGLHLHMHRGKGSCQGQLCNWHVRLPFSCQGQHYSKHGKPP